MKSFRIDDVMCSLPKGIRIKRSLENDSLEFISADSAVQFQLEWEWIFNQLWNDLIDSEREKIAVIHPPYTEKMVSDFLLLLKKSRSERAYCRHTNSEFTRLDSR